MLKVVCNGNNSTGVDGADFAAVAIDLPARRDQLTTRGDPRFSELRAKIYARIKSGGHDDFA